jgi:bifunctional DNA-binding transcriptional regulator/antitoxin component of YhaV-PrlF toxin-antitoxin module
MQHCSMITLALSKRGSLTLPPALRRKMGLDKMRNPLLLVEERDGGLFLQPAVAMAVRDLPKEQIQAWITRDEADLKDFQEAKKGKKR